jgi:hypothetical protein
MTFVPSVTDLRKVYEQAHGEYLGVYHLLGLLYANVDLETVNRLYAEAEAKVRQQEETATVCVYCYSYYSRGTSVCPQCNEYDGMMNTTEAKEQELI